MSRSGYSDDCDQWSLIRWRGAVASAVRGKRGQEFLRELAGALDAIPERKLISEELEVEGQVCALGSVGKARGLDMSDIDPDDRETVAGAFKIPHALACEIMYENDELAAHYYYCWDQPAEHVRAYWKENADRRRWHSMRNWVDRNLKTAGEGVAQ